MGVPPAVMFTGDQLPTVAVRLRVDRTPPSSVSAWEAWKLEKVPRKKRKDGTQHQINHPTSSNIYPAASPLLPAFEWLGSPPPLQILGAARSGAPHSRSAELFEGLSRQPLKLGRASGAKPGRARKSSFAASDRLPRAIRQKRRECNCNGGNLS